MTCEKFESVMGYHCSPVLMGMKPANLVSFSKEKMPELPEIISDYEESLEREGIRMEIICGCRKHYLLLVYRPDMLQEYLMLILIKRQTPEMKSYTYPTVKNILSWKLPIKLC